MIESDASWRLFDTIKSIASSNGQSTNAMATCVRVLSDGTRMMQLVGSSILTPLNGSMAAEISQGDMAEVRIEDGVMSLTANVSNPSVGQSEVDDAVADRATVRQLGESNARIEHLEVTALTAESATIANLQADTAKVHDLTADQLTAATAYVGALDAGNVTAAQLIADHGTIGTLDTTYMHADMANADVAWIQNGTIKDGAIVSAMINDVSANKLTAGTINGSVINVTNLNADNITTGTINGQRIGQGSLSLDKLSEDVYTESEVDSKLATMQAEIDGAIETWTGTVVPTLNNSPASGWTTNAERDTHVGDVYFVVNSQSQQNGYNYRFTKSGNTYSWQLIKDNDVTNALQRLETAEGKITSIESFDSTVSSFMTSTNDELTSVKSRATSLETRMTDAEGDISDKVDTSTFNTLSQTVDTNSASITSLSSTVSQKADGSTVTALTNRVSTVEQDVDGIETSIGELQTTVSEKADSSTVTTVSNKLNNVSDTVDGHTQTLTSVQNTLSSKADSSTVSTLTTKVNNVSDTVDGHTSQLSSITSTQTTMQSTLDKTVKSSIQLWYSKANTTAPSKPNSQVTSTSTSGNAWRIVVPAYNASYPHYYYCWQYEYTDGTYGWSAVVRDIAMGESQSTARTADSNASAAVTTANTASTNASTALSTANTANTNASDAKTAAATANTNASTALTTANTANTNASDAKTAATTASTTASEAKTTAETAASDASTAKSNAASAVSTANSASTTATNAQNTANSNIKSSVQLWFTKANSTAPNKPTSVVSTSNANTANAWNLVVPVWNSSYPHYFYCYQQQKGDGTYQWTDVVYDRATSEAQQLANTTSTNLSTLQTNYATFKQQTEQFESTVGTRLTTIESDIDGVESRVSTNETSISNNSSAIALKANSSDVYTKTDVDGKITQEVTDRNAAITAKANEITSTVSQTYTTKQEFADLEVGGRNLVYNTGDWSSWACTPKATVSNGVLTTTNTDTSAFQRANGWFTLDKADIVDRVITISFEAKKTDETALNTMCFQLFTTSAEPKSVTSGNIPEGTRYYVPLSTSSGSKVTIENATAINATTWTKVTITFKPSEVLNTSYTEYAYLAMYIGINNRVGSAQYRRLKAEFANRASDWTPAPEDIESRVDKAESSITQNATNINAKVSKNDVINQINLSTEGVLIDADRVEINGTAVFNAIKSSTDAAYDAKGAASTAETNAKAYADAIEVGGRNLLKGTRDFSSISTSYGSLSSETYNGCMIWLHKKTSTTSSNDVVTWNGQVTPEPDTYYTLSFWAKASEAFQIGSFFYGNAVASGYNSSGNTTDRADGYILTTLSTKWERYWVTWKTRSDVSGAKNLIPIRIHAATTGTVYIAGVKLEEGNKATDWSPAPEDIVSRTQRIYYRWNSATAPAAPTSWVTKNDDGSALWTKMHVAITSTHKYIYTCEQYEMADGILGHTDVLLDNTITVIDGGNIITGTVTANKLNAADINASKSLTIGALDTSTQSKINNGDSALTKINYYSRRCLVGQSTSTTTNPWYKVASSSITAQYVDKNIVFDVYNSGGYTSTNIGTSMLGTLSAHFRASGNIQSCESPTLTWSNRGSDITLTNFVLAYKVTAGSKVDCELWVKCDRAYAGYEFAVRYDDSRAAHTETAGWDLYNTWAAGSQSAITSGYTQVVSKDGDAARGVAESYITQVDQSGITIHPSGGTSNRVEIDADGMEVYKGNVSVASYGDTARIGKQDAAHIDISSNSVIIDSGGTTNPVIMTTSNGYSYIQADYIDALQSVSAIGGLSGNMLNIGGTNTIYGVRFGFSSATTNSNGITTFNPNLGRTPTAVFVAAGKASGETETVAKIAVPMVWSIDSATQVQVRWQRSDTNAWLTNNTVGWYWLALA